MIDRVVGNTYRIVEKIGEGGMGTVYRAVDLVLEREVALKAIRPELAREPEIVERFRAEARALARVSHPAIATIYSFFLDGDELFLAMELVRGRSLSEVLAAEGRLPWERAVRLLSSALVGIEEAHRAGIIHRDLKPDNLMLTDSAAGERLKVMDFGIARVAGSGHLTRTGLLVGTLRYMAPEQIRGEEVDHRADLYALGAVLFQMLTGQPPFDGPTDFAILRAQIEDPPVPPGSLVPGIPDWLDRAVMRALAKKPDERFADVGEMRCALEIRSSRPEDATRPTLPAPSLEELQTVVTPPRPRPIPLIPQIPQTSPPSNPATSYRPVELRSASSRGWWMAFAAVVLIAVAAGLGAAFWNRGAGGDAGVAANPSESPQTMQSPTSQPAVPASSSLSPAVSEPSAAPTPTTSVTSVTARPAPTPVLREPLHRETPPPAAPGEGAPIPVTRLPVETPPPAEPAPAAEPPAADSALGDDLGQLADGLVDRSSHLVEVYNDFLGQKEDSGADLTPADEQLKDELDNFQDRAEKLQGLIQGGFFSRIRHRAAPERRAMMVRRGRDLVQQGEQVERLMAQVQPGPEVRQAWQEVRQRWKKIVALIGSG
jgi:serine/threonine-protein kinase